MSDDFDPYLQWLGIRPEERPVDHYRLLGLPRFEADVTRIGQAADQRMSLVRSFQTGPRGAHTQRLLNDLATARVCLLNPSTKTTYDDFLRGLEAAGNGGDLSSDRRPVSDSAVLPPSIGQPMTGGSLPGGVPTMPVAGASASPTGMPYGVPTPGYVPGCAAPMPATMMHGGPMPSAIPMATPVAYLPSAAYPGGVPMATPIGSVAGPAYVPYAAAPPVAGHFAPSYAPSAAPPNPPPMQPPTPPPIAPAAAKAPPKRERRTKVGSERTVSSEESVRTAEEGEESPPAGAEHIREPLIARRWFPLAALGAVGVIAGAVWGVGRLLRGPEVTDSTSEGDSDDAAGDSEEMDDANRGAESAPQDNRATDIVIAQEGNGQINFPATVAKLYGPSLTLHVTGPEPVITGWTADDDRLSWDFRVVRPDIFVVEVTYAAEDAWAGSRYVVAVSDAEKTSEIVSTGGAGNFRTDTLFLPVKRQGKHTLTLTTVERTGAQLWVFKSIRFKPQGQSPK